MLKRKSKRFLSIILAVAMIVVLFPVAAFAEDEGSISTADDLKNAIENATDETIVQLGADLSFDDQLTIPDGKNITLDLNGHKLTISESILVNGGRLTVQDNTATIDPQVSQDYESVTYSSGSITTSGNIHAVKVTDGGNLTLNSGTIQSVGNCGVYVTGNSDATNQDLINSHFIMNGGYILAQEFAVVITGRGAIGDINGGVLFTKDNAVVGGNGTKTATEDLGGTTINISGGTMIGHITTTNYIACGIYHPQEGQLNISGGTIYADGGVGVLMRAGDANITGGKIIATGEVDGKVGDSQIVVGSYGVVFDDRSGYPGKQENDTVLISDEANVSGEVGAVTVVGEEEESPNNDRIEITGGTFSHDITKYVVAGNKYENGQVVIDNITAVASVNGVGFTSLQAAIDAAEKNEGTVTLLKKIDLTDGVEISGTVTLDLNGFTISDSVEWKPEKNVDYLLAVKRGADLTINDSSANKTGAITTANDKIAVAVKLTIKGEDGEGDAATLTVNGGTLKAPAYGISGNGTRHNTELTINGGTIESTKGAGIYQPQDGKVTIKGGTITGPTGIEIRSGQLDVNGGTFISTAKKYEPPVENDSGTTVTGAAIAVSQHTTKKAINVTITGGTFSGPKAFVETNVQGIPEKGAITLTINGGTFESAVESDDITNFINGGHFALRVAPTLLAGNINTQLTDADNDVAPYSYYSRVQDAVDAADEGDTVTVLADSNENVTVSKPIKIETAGSVKYTGTVSAGNGYDVVIGEDGTITVYKEPEYTGKFSYEIFTKVGDNGTISVDRYATEGDEVTITVSPDEAYMLDELTVTTGGKEVEVKDNGDGTYTFTMPSGDVKIEVTFAEDPDWEPAPEMPFTDVNEGDWFYDVVLYTYDNGLMTGVSATEFAPNQTTTRGMIVSMLARLEGVTSAEDAGFADVAANDWYATAVNWAASVGVVNGYEDNTFRPNAPITREQMAAILYNYADYKGYDVSARADLSDYADAADVSSWAEDVLSWANAEGLINGMTATTIDPQGATTRAQTAAMFERFLKAHEA